MSDFFGGAGHGVTAIINACSAVPCLLHRIDPAFRDQKENPKILSAPIEWLVSRNQRWGVFTTTMLIGNTMGSLAAVGRNGLRCLKGEVTPKEAIAQTVGETSVYFISTLAGFYVIKPLLEMLPHQKAAADGSRSKQQKDIIFGLISAFAMGWFTGLYIGWECNVDGIIAQFLQ